jgi:hypothetical protein
MPDYKKYEPFTIKGITFYWKIKKYDSNPLLEIEYDNDQEVYKCRNPWNLVEDMGIRKEIMEHMPKKNASLEQAGKPLKQIEFFTKEQLSKRLYDLIGADCWQVYSLNNSREPQTSYFNSFDDNSDSNFNERESQQKRNKLLEDQKPLINDLDNGFSVYVILNHRFMDFVYKKIPNQELYTECEIIY